MWQSRDVAKRAAMALDIISALNFTDGMLS